MFSRGFLGFLGFSRGFLGFLEVSNVFVGDSAGFS